MLLNEIDRLSTNIMIAGAGVVLGNPFDTADLRGKGFYSVSCILYS